MKYFLLFIPFLLTIFSCKTGTDAVAAFEKPRVPEWHKYAVIYEVNLRQYTKENTFRSFETHLPRLKEMGVDILWFMPITPISKKNRKGELGSPYSVGDYMTTNPDYGTMEDFKHMVQAIHDAGMYVIMDWVPNHTGWDNPWITQHPEWYTKDSLGNITDPIDYNTGKSWGWTDVADLNYDVPEMRQEMIRTLKFWITETNIDGYRMDVAHGVPVDFWETLADSLYAIKPLFMLSEGEVPDIVNNGTFIADYAWEMHHLLNDIAASQGENSKKQVNMVNGNPKEGNKTIALKTALHIDTLLGKKSGQYSKGYQMQFTSNHDENSWAGTEFARMGKGHKAFAVLTATLPGIPLIYSGQESAMDKQLQFFVKDSIPWGNYSYAPFYKTLFDLKHKNQALWNGSFGGDLVRLQTGNDASVYAFTREKGGDKVVVMINLSNAIQSCQLAGQTAKGLYTNVFTGQKAVIEENQSFSLQPWEYLVLSNK